VDEFFTDFMESKACRPATTIHFNVNPNPGTRFPTDVHSSTATPRSSALT